MAKTIQQLSEEYANKKVNESPYNEYKGYSFVRQKELTRFDGYDIEQAYECGANAVLSEIERIINENEDGCLALERIQLKIDELK